MSEFDCREIFYLWMCGMRFGRFLREEIKLGELVDVYFPESDRGSSDST